jgi:outer membrane beta-barrel protein
MKRPAISLLVCVALVGWAATGHAKKGGGGKAGADSGDNSGAQSGDAAAGDQAGAADQSAAGSKESAAPSESLEGGDETQPGKVEEEVGTPKATVKTSTLSWNDILVIPRKAFLKGGRLEFQPFTGITVNDNLIRHYVFGIDLNYFLTDVFWVGVEGQYYIHQLTTEEELLGSEFNLAPSLNQYLYGGALNFGYVPVYGKFAWFNSSIVNWEIWASAGIGATWTKVIPRDPANSAAAFTNTDLTPNVALGGRFFFPHLDWISVNFALRDYILPDKFETQQKPDPYTDATTAKANGQSVLVNNVVFSIGVGLYLPTKFQYKSPR